MPIELLDISEFEIVKCGKYYRFVNHSRFLATVGYRTEEELLDKKNCLSLTLAALKICRGRYKLLFTKDQQDGTLLDKTEKCFAVDFGKVLIKTEGGSIVAYFKATNSDEEVLLITIRGSFAETQPEVIQMFNEFAKTLANVVSIVGIPNERK